ncbi:MAG: beta-galactosidase, partial [Lachnospiraceae bacterium]|nr:beta-galactosidase [Lachnospiraceae bacterium]
MDYSVDLRDFKPQTLYDLGEDFTGHSAGGGEISFNNYFMEIDRKPYFAVSGEFHYSRMAPERWEDELIKLRMGGINIVSTYVLWNHHEEEEGCFDFTGRRNLRSFVELCAKHGLWVILRIGPFAHGEVRNGGLPDWLFGKPFEVRSLDAGFLKYVERFYDEIGKRTAGLYYKDGGPVIAVQLDNEYMHSSAKWEMTVGSSNEWINAGKDGEPYILKLREMALKAGIVPAFFTGTAWGGAAYSPRVMPLWGGYAYRPWIFYFKTGEHPATEVFVYEDYHRDGAACADDFKPAYRPSERPYACCEMGAGMMSCYSFRAVFPAKSVDALANIKLASGCNFIGYYMFHGGTNPIGKHGTYMNESQVTKLSYDFQAAIGEYGQVRESYRRLKSIHFFTRFFGDRLARMETVLPEGASAIAPKDTDTLRFAVRTDGQGGFLFINNYQDHCGMKAKEHEKVYIALPGETVGYDISIAPEENAILPFNLELDGILLKQANAQPVLRTVVNRRITYVFMVPDGMDGDMRFEDGADVNDRYFVFKDTEVRYCTGNRRNLPQGKSGQITDADKVCIKTVNRSGRDIDIICIGRRMADNMYLLQNGGLIFTGGVVLEDEKGGLRLETSSASNTVLTYPAELLESSEAAVRAGGEGDFGCYSIDTAEVCVRVRAEKVSAANAEVARYLIDMPGVFAGETVGTGGRGITDMGTAVGDMLLRIGYSGDVAELFAGEEMISDNFWNGDVWEI